MAGTYGLNFVKLSYAMLSVSIAFNIFSLFFCVCIFFDALEVYHFASSTFPLIIMSILNPLLL